MLSLQAGKLAQDSEGAPTFAEAVLEDCFSTQVVPSALEGTATAAAVAAAVIIKAVTHINTRQGRQRQDDQEWLHIRVLKCMRPCVHLRILTLVQVQSALLLFHPVQKLPVADVPHSLSVYAVKQLFKVLHCKLILSSMALDAAHCTSHIPKQPIVSILCRSM